MAGFAAAGVLPAREVAACSTATVYGTVFATVYVHDVVTITHTITNPPPTVTIVEQDPGSKLSFIASYDTESVIEQSQLLPVSAHPDPKPTVVTEMVQVPGFEATEISYRGKTGTVFYIHGTGGSVEPTSPIIVEVTTFTILPTFATRPPSVANQAKAAATSNSTLHMAFTSSSNGWNYTNSNSSMWPAASGHGGAVPTEEATSTVTVTNTVATVTRVVASTAVASYGHGPEPYGYPPPDTAHPVEKRQTCLWVSATIGGQEVGWCNNWDGAATFSYTSWETTIFPTYVPGVGPVDTSTSSSPPTTSLPSSVRPSTTHGSSSSKPASVTVSPVPTTAVPAPATCGQTGPFIISFDDLPVLSVFNNNTAGFPEIFNPYEHFFWGDGWTYVPPPTEPFSPHDGTRLAQFIPSLANKDIGSPSAGLIPPSSFGAGPRAADSAYWFSAATAWVACDTANVTCDFVATAYQWDIATQSEVVVATQHFNVPPCHGFVDCRLTEIRFNYLFYKMTTLSFYANVEGKISIFWLDSLSLDWYDNSCEAGLKRISSRKR
ncbi:hypothetical protein PV08_10481 [Exophiala spinifera]|uniref:DUF7371 domain-containing protein n=1 Tax=Exophiala spinifera TaxID=91928 RepID=A0A0D1Y873_9EURO|nr:uncharacterized protein PV08_10481 [Exophiala spinifera]KIW11181.1 hypothetical protein PV08_10481 [Exophiala spinifera]